MKALAKRGFRVFIGRIYIRQQPRQQTIKLTVLVIREAIF